MSGDGNLYDWKIDVKALNCLFFRGKEIGRERVVDETMMK